MYNPFLLHLDSQGMISLIKAVTSKGYYSFLAFATDSQGETHILKQNSPMSAQGILHTVQNTQVDSLQPREFAAQQSETV